MRRFQQVAKGELRVFERYGRDLQSLQIKDYERFHGVAEIQQAGMFEQIVTALFIRRAVDRNGVTHAPAQRKQPLHVIHMVVGEQKLLKRSCGPAIGKIVQPGVDEGHGVVKADHAATGFPPILRGATRPRTGQAVAAPGGHALRAAGTAEGEAQTHTASS